MRITIMQSRFTPLAAAALFATALIAHAAPSEPPEDADTTESTTEPEALPTLDDLLGLEPDDSETEADIDPAVDPDRAELDRALSGEQAADMFVQAVQQMSDAADLLELASAPGAQTQRLQDEILRKLDILIEQAKQQQSSSSSSSSSQGDPSQQQGEQPNQPQPGKPQQQEGEQNQPSEGESSEDGTPPGFQDGPLADRLDELHAAWGALPTRVREALSQGSGDEFSAFYQSMTESYYRKLAGDKPNQERTP